VLTNFLLSYRSCAFFCSLFTIRISSIIVYGYYWY